MPDILFEQHLFSSPMQSKPFLCDEEADIDAEDIQEVLETMLPLLVSFAEGVDDDSDLQEDFSEFCSYYGLDEDDASFLGGVIEAAAAAEDDDHERTANAVGMTPLRQERGIKNFLRQLRIQASEQIPNPAFDADRYKTFARPQNRFGVNYSYDNDYNNQRPSRTLKPPTLSVSTENYQAIDSVGINNKMDYRVLHIPSGTYQTAKMPREDCEQLASELNQEASQLDEHIPSTAITENLLTPLSPQFLAAFDNVTHNKNYTMSGNIAQSDHNVNHAQNWRETQQLINERRAKFGDNRIDEFNAIRTIQQKGARRGD